MFFQNIIKISTLFVALLLCQLVMSQGFQTSKYNKEHNPYFTFNTFQRGIKSEILAKELDVFKQKDKDSWTVSDSFRFAEISLLTQNFELSHHYLSHLEKSNHPNKKVVYLLLIDCYIENKFDIADSIMTKHFTNADNHFENTFKNILHAKQVGHTNDSINYIDNLRIATNVIIKKGNKEYNTRVITPLKNAREALTYFVMYIHKDDPVIGKCFNEMGLALEKNVSLNQAYIAYSIARIYDRKDEEILENVKRIKAKHVHKNYNTPNFRKFFPRIEYWRFDYEILKEKIITNNNDTIPLSKPSLIANNKNNFKLPFPFPIEALIPIGILFIFLFIIIFTKTKK